MRFTDENKEAIVIFSGRVARELLRSGFTIIDIKPDKTNKIKTVFVFRIEKDIEKQIYELTSKNECFLALNDK